MKLRNRIMFKNKKADIAITILVIGIVAVCILALLSFYLFDDKAQKVNKINLNEFYDTADAIKFSEYSSEYEGNFNSQKNELERVYTNGGIGGFTGLFEKDLLKVKYSIGK